MVVYRLVLVSSLPAIDASRTVLEKFSPVSVYPFIQLMLFQQCRKLFILLYLTALVPIAIFPIFSPSSDSLSLLLHWTPLLVLPCVLMVVTESRLELIQLVAQTYEFWFIQVTLVIFMLCVGAFLQVHRIGITLVFFLLVWVSTILDAIQLQAFHEVILAIWTVSAVTPFLLMTFMNAVPNAQDFVIVQFKHHALNAREVIINSVITLCIFALRSTWLYYKARTSLSLNNPVSATSISPNTSPEASFSNGRRNNSQRYFVSITSISYRCRVYWQEETSAETIIVSPRLISVAPQPQGTAPLQKRPMFYVDPESRFESSDVIWPRLFAWLSQYGRALTLLIPCSWIATIAGFSVVHFQPQSIVSYLVSILALVLSVFIVVSIMVGVYHPLVLRRLCQSFDVVFLSFQTTLALLCVCDLFFWDFRYCVLFLTIWLWMH